MINNKEAFLDFLRKLIIDFKENPQNWEHKNIESYLGAAADWIEDMEGYYLNKKVNPPIDINWQVFADILMAAKMYE